MEKYLVPSFEDHLNEGKNIKNKSYVLIQKNSYGDDKPLEVIFPFGTGIDKIYSWAFDNLKLYVKRPKSYSVNLGGKGVLNLSNIIITMKNDKGDGFEIILEVIEQEVVVAKL